MTMQFCPQCGSALTPKDIGGVTRLACSQPACHYVFWDNPVPVIAALVMLEGSYVLARNAGWPNGVFSLITGYLEKNETPEQAVARETREELGLIGHVQELIGTYIYKEKNQLILAYAIKASGTVRLNEELVEYKLIPAGQLEKYDFGRLYITRQIVHDWMQSSKE